MLCIFFFVFQIINKCCDFLERSCFDFFIFLFNESSRLELGLTFSSPFCCYMGAGVVKAQEQWAHPINITTTTTAAAQFSPNSEEGLLLSNRTNMSCESCAVQFTTFKRKVSCQFGEEKLKTLSCCLTLRHLASSPM